MQNFSHYPSYNYSSTLLSVGRSERTPKAVASEVAIGDQSYYGVFRATGDPDSGVEDRYYNPYFQNQEQRYLYNDLANYNNDKDGCYINYGMTTTRSASESCCEEEELRHQQSACHQYSSDYLVGKEFGSALSSLPLQIFINSLSDALSCASSVGTGTTDYQYHHHYVGSGEGPGALNATPMGSTTKLITSETSSSYRWKCCGEKCCPAFGTLFMTLSLTISLGNILRLPTAVFLHGGGTFLVAYVTIAVLLGIPLLFLEITLGQFCQQGTTKLWRAVPLFKGVGVAKILSCLLVSLYYPLLIASAVLYSVWSILNPMPTSQCISKILPRYTGPDAETGLSYVTELCSRDKNEKGALEEEVLWFGIQVGALLVVWFLITLCIFKNSKTFRVSACTIVPIALFAVITLIAEGIQRNTTGIDYLLHIRWESLLTFELWYHALVQFMFSTHLGFGNITTCAGRLYPKNNPFWTSVFFTLVNVAVGIGFVCVVYMWIGDLVSTGNAVHVPESQEYFVLMLIYDVTSRCYGRFSQLWANIAFLLIILAGLTSLVSLMYTVVVGVMVETKTKKSWWFVTALICFLGFAATCCFTLPENFNIVQLLDHYVVGKIVVTSTILEVVGFVWVYGLEALANDFEFVLGYKLSIIWKMLWFISPLILAVVEVWSWITLSVEEISHEKSSLLLYIVGWIIYFIVWAVIIGVAIWQIFSQVDYNLSQKYASSLKPTRNWGPVDPIYRHCWVQWRKQYQATGEKDFTLKRRGTRDYTHSVKRNRHAGPASSRYSISPPSNQDTLQYKTENMHLDSNISTITDYSTWVRNKEEREYNGYR